MSDVLIVVEKPKLWALQLPGVERVSARAYLTDPSFAQRRGAKVFNLCRSYRYQSLGYYVSLLAEARGHRVLPSVTTIQDLKSRSLVRLISDDLDALIQRSLSSLASDDFVLSIYFGRNMARRHQRLARELFNLFPAPLLRATFSRHEGIWSLAGLRPVAVSEIPDEHREFVVESARTYFAGRRGPTRSRPATRFDLAILVDPQEAMPPSDAKALEKLSRAALDLGLRTELVTRDDYGRLAEFDALFIRATTQVDHFTYRFARRAAADGLVVIDDPVSILRAANKVYLAEALGRAGVPMPRGMVVHRGNLNAVAETLGLPAVLKLPDGSFSRAVARVDDREALLSKAREYLETSDLLIAQEYLPTDFDWRIGVLDQQVLFAARYWMARGHWQIARRDHRGRVQWGRCEAVDPAEVSPHVLETALTAANRVGDGFYGVDVKEKDGQAYVIEVNDNPNLESGAEDAVLGDELYRRLAEVFLRRIEQRKEKRTTQ